MLKAGQILSRLGGVSNPWSNLVRSSSSFQPILAIRREDNSVWERRAPLSPAHVRKLVKDGIKVIVQPSNRRAYPMQVFICGKLIVVMHFSMLIRCSIEYILCFYPK